MTTECKHVLLTGPPGCGKTTAIQRTLEQLKGTSLAGFYTREIRGEGRRTGFEMVGLRTQRVVLLASVHSQSELRLRRYGIELPGLEELVQQEFCETPRPQLFVLDEIGKIECFSQMFVDTIRNVLDGDVPILGTVAIRGDGLIGEVKQRPDTVIIEVTNKNRDELPPRIAEELRVED